MKKKTEKKKSNQVGGELFFQVKSSYFMHYVPLFLSLESHLARCNNFANQMLLDRLTCAIV